MAAKAIRSSPPCEAAWTLVTLAGFSGKSFEILKDRRSDPIRARSAMIKTKRAAFMGSSNLFT
jgi:hypothetical protein